MESIGFALNLDMKSFFAFTKTLPALALIALLSQATLAQGEKCGEILNFDKPDAAKILNDRLIIKYPNLDFIVRDPDLFVKTMRERFEEMKKQGKDPFTFDFSEAGMADVVFMRDVINKRLVESAERRKQIEIDFGGKNFLSRFLSKKSIAIHELDVFDQYMAELKIKMEGHIAVGKVNYKDYVEESYYYSRVTGHFHARTQSLLLKLFLFIDRSINGYRQLPIDREYAMFKAGNFALFQKKSSVATFVRAEVPFAEVLKKQDKLETILFPTSANVGRDIFFRLLNKDINLVGIADEPILADGVLRPGGDFWNHDGRHESFKYFELNYYQTKHNLSDAKLEKLLAKSEEWLVQYYEQLAKVEDKELKRAIVHLAFNYHHDAGFPFIPTVYFEAGKTISALAAPYNLYFMMKWSGQGVDFSKPFVNIPKADAWLKQFWMSRLEEERSILNDDGPI